MATPRKLPSGKWRIEMMIKGKRSSAVFRTKSECNIWLAQQSLEANTPIDKKNYTFRQLIERYLKEITPHKKSARIEALRLKKTLREEEHDLADKRLRDITKSDVARWRDKKRKTGLSDSSINREWTTISNAFNIAINEWEWCKENPFNQIKKTSNPPPRDRLLTPEEIEKMDYVMGYSDESDLSTLTQRVAAAMHFAMQTALRAKEIYLLKWADINGRVLKVNDSKTITGIREVPLTKKAMAILKRLKAVNGDKELVFDLTASQLDANFRKARATAGLYDKDPNKRFTFHDTRANGITMLSKKLDPFSLARIVGHKNLSMTQAYYREKAIDMIDSLDE